jgi:hypothetical protein
MSELQEVAKMFVEGLLEVAVVNSFILCNHARELQSQYTDYMETIFQELELVEEVRNPKSQQPKTQLPSSTPGPEIG